MSQDQKLICRLEDGASVRQRGAEDFPLSLGGSRADIPVTGLSSEDPCAFLGLSQGRLFVEPAASGTKVWVNGAVLAASRWLNSGDRIRVAETEVECDLSPGLVRLSIHGVAVEGSGVIRLPSVTGKTIRPADFRPRSLESLGRSGRSLRPMTALVAALLILLATAAVLVLTARSVAVIVEPTPEVMEIHGGLLRMEVAGRYLLRPGRYKVLAKKSGYRDLQDDMEVLAKSNQEFRFVLELLPGELILSTGDVQGAQVRIDGELVGQTPLAPVELAAGEYELEVVASRYRVHTQSIQIQGGGVSQTLAVELDPAWAAVTFDSHPKGAQVLVDGQAVGETPLTLDIGAGVHEMELLLQGYRSHADSFEVVAGEPLEYATVRLVPADGQLHLTSVPAGAMVTRDGTYMGQTPLDLALAPSRDHHVELSKAGFEKRAETVRVGPEERRSLEVRLPEILGVVKVECWPEDARLLVNGVDQGVANQTLTLQAQPQEIEIRKEGFESFRVTLTPQPEHAELLSVVLKTPAEARAAVLPRVIKSPQGQELRLVDRGKLRMGAPRREPGRRSNEVTRNVELTRAFYIGVQEVSNREFRAFKASHLSGKLGSVSLEVDHHPVVRVSWDEAARYCNWLSQKEGLDPVYVEKNGRLVGVQPLSRGYRLPTEAEWAWVARFAGGRSFKYPWGDSLPIPEGAGNYGDLSADEVLGGSLPGYRDPYRGTGPVSGEKANALGLLNLGGNAAEWVHDVYAIRPSQGSEVDQDPLGPESGPSHVIKGASWMTTNVTRLRLSYRDYGDQARPDVGFRIARYAE